MAERGVTALLAAVAAGLAGLALWGALASEPVSFEAGPEANTLAARLRPGQTACSPAFLTPIAFSRVELQLGTFRRPGPPLAAAVRGAGGVLARGRLAAGYPDVSRPPIVLDRRVAAETRVRICLRNAGPTTVALYGTGGDPLRDSRARRRTLASLPTLTLATGRSRSALATVPAVIERMAAFKGSVVTPALLWLLAALVAIGVPALLARAVGLGVREPER